MSALPRDPTPDASLALLREGYRFVSNRCERFGSDGFRTRLMLHEAICLRGREAAEFFYDGSRFTRRGAMPKRTLRMLQGPGSVQQLDDAAHRHRKALFLEVAGKPAVAPLVERLEAEWRRSLPDWAARESLVLHAEMRLLLTRVACGWAGVRLEDPNARIAADWLGGMIDNAGSFGPRHWRARRKRAAAERWIEGLVAAAREPGSAAAQPTPLQAFAQHRDPEGQLLDPRTAAIEVVNLLRPVVAVGRFIVFAALALHRRPDWRERLRAYPEKTLAFVQEVRRYYPFFPLVGGVARRNLDWQGSRIAEGAWVLLDLYGTDRHPALWDRSDRFLPERFAERSPDPEKAPYDLVAQGAGRHAETHRCPGEWATIGLLQAAVRLLVEETDYAVPPQDLSVPLNRMPTLPASGLVLRDVRPAAGSA